MTTEPHNEGCSLDDEHDGPCLAGRPLTKREAATIAAADQRAGWRRFWLRLNRARCRRNGHLTLPFGGGSYCARCGWRTPTW